MTMTGRGWRTIRHTPWQGSSTRFVAMTKRKKREDLHIVKEAARLTGVPESTLRTWLKQGRYPVTTSPGGYMLVHDREILQISTDYANRAKTSKGRLKGGTSWEKPPRNE
ncbi:MerR family DNA-binding transcriptional regulator [Kocuria sp. HSID16901]|nr:MerR family DNA-binding transcriptional regulator [Kocuria sp. HSID16901]